MKPLFSAAVLASALLLLGGCSEARPERVRMSAAAQSVEPSWSTAAGMHTGRFRHTATQLLDGKLLVVGGATVGDPQRRPGIGSSPTAAAELFDPVTSKFTEVGSLAGARWGHSATLLRSGQVLIAGGFDEQGRTLASAELYDPSEQRFVDAGAMHQARALQTATLLEDDRVLLLGGLASLEEAEGPPYRSVASTMEAYQPGASRFADVGDSADLTFPHAAILLGDGRVAIAWPEATAELGAISLAWFHPSDDALVSAGSVPCSHPCQDLLLHREASPDGQLAALDIVTAQEEIRVVPQGELVTPENATHTDHAIDIFYVDGTRVENTLFQNSGSGASGSMATRADAGSSSPLVVGGWVNRENLPSISNGLINIAGRQYAGNAEPEPKPEPCAAAEGCAPWTSVGRLTEERAWPTASSLASGVLVAGGMGQSPLSSTESSTLQTTATAISGLESAAVFGHAATLLGDGRVLFTGTYAESTTAYVLATLGEVPSPAGSLLAQRAQHQSFLLPSGKVLLAAGETLPEAANEELFDPITRVSQDLGFRLQARHNGLALTRNRFLFAGENGLELLDASTFTTQRIEPPAPLGCARPGLARLTNGRVAVVGRTSLFELDVEQLRASSPVALPTSRCDTAVAGLPDGGLAIIGGVPEQGGESAVVEKYDPVTRSVSGAPSLLALAGVISARPVLRFSKLLLVGGVSWWPAGAPQVVNWSADTASDFPFAGKYFSDSQSVTTLADGSLLRASPQTGLLNVWWLPKSPPERLELMPTDASALRLGGAPREVTPGSEVELTGLELSKTWPENSGGISQGSATNAPVAMWIPVLDGWPVLGTFRSWSADRATWRVPHPPFPGLGTFGYVRSGTWHPLELVRIKDQESGGSCLANSECPSGHCVDEVCCDRACDGACQACTAALKGGGEDGVCEAAAAETLDDACAADPGNPCGNTGVCDGSGACALTPDGQSCAEESACMRGICVQKAPPVATCVDGWTRKDIRGKESSCNGHRCLNGVCEEVCASSKDCFSDFVCNSNGKCGKPPDKPNHIASCAPSCRVTGREPIWSELWSLGLGLLVIARRRRARSLPAVPAPQPV